MKKAEHLKAITFNNVCKMLSVITSFLLTAICEYYLSPLGDQHIAYCIVRCFIIYIAITIPYNHLVVVRYFNTLFVVLGEFILAFLAVIIVAIFC